MMYDHFDLWLGGCPSYPSYLLQRWPHTLLPRPVTENPSSDGAANDHLSLNPVKGNPLDLKRKVDVSYVTAAKRTLTPCSYHTTTQRSQNACFYVWFVFAFEMRHSKTRVVGTRPQKDFAILF